MESYPETLRTKMIRETELFLQRHLNNGEGPELLDYDASKVKDEAESGGRTREDLMSREKFAWPILTDLRWRGKNGQTSYALPQWVTRPDCRHRGRPN